MQLEMVRGLIVDEEAEILDEQIRMERHGSDRWIDRKITGNIMYFIGFSATIDQNNNIISHTRYYILRMCSTFDATLLFESKY